MGFRLLGWICQSSPSGRGAGRDSEIAPTVSFFVRWSGFVNPDRAVAQSSRHTPYAVASPVQIRRWDFYRTHYPFA